MLVWSGLSTITYGPVSSIQFLIACLTFRKLLNSSWWCIWCCWFERYFDLECIEWGIRIVQVWHKDILQMFCGVKSKWLSMVKLKTDIRVCQMSTHFRWSHGDGSWGWRSPTSLQGGFQRPKSLDISSTNTSLVCVFCQYSMNAAIVNSKHL